jgi:putative NIF3 family GTP cyclohydrolase 1 type 2
MNGLIDDLPEDTVDRVIYGDPDREVNGIAVAWMPYRETVERAAEQGANLLVVHEPTFYDHRELDRDGQYLAEAAAKKQLIDEVGITVIRCHDVWDAMPEIGIPYAWGDFLGLSDFVKQVRHYNVYKVPEQTAGAFANHVADRTATLGQQTIWFYGDPERRIRTVGLGTGCISNPFRSFELGADLAISVDDVVRAWIAGEWCRDTGRPLVVVNHCVSEEPGMVTLAAYLEKAFPGTPVTHIAQGCSYEPVVSSK